MRTQFNKVEKIRIASKAQENNTSIMYELIHNADRYTNARTCICCDCAEKTLAPSEGHAVAIPSLGFSYRYLCNDCYNNARNAYHSNARQGFSKKGTDKETELAKTEGGYEFELQRVDDNTFTTLSTMLNLLGHKGEADCTVSEEHPTLILKGLACLAFLRSLEKYDMLSIVDNPNCGAHMHNAIDNIGIVRRFYHSLFMPLNDYLKSLGSEELERVFGSDFRGYATPINRNSDAMSHSNFVNCQHEKTLEFRLPRVTSARQYIECAKFWRKCVWYINSHFCAVWNESASRDEKKALAQKVGAQLVQYAQYLVNGDYIKLSV